MDIDKEIDVVCNRLRFLPKQLEVLNGCTNSEMFKKFPRKSVLYSGAFRAGKTFLLVHAAIIVALENKGCRGMIVSQSYTQLKGVIFSLFEEELSYYQEAIKNAGYNFTIANVYRSSTDMRAEFFNGSTVLFRSSDKERKLAGYTLDFFGLDEPVDMSESVFSQLWGRISGTGNSDVKFGLLTTNPGSETHWIYEYFFNKPIDEFTHVETTTYDNILLPDYENYVKDKEKVWDKDWVRRYLNGTWGFFEGAVYKSFNIKKHVGDFKDVPVNYYVAGVDFGLRHPFCILILGITDDKRIVVKEEYSGQNKTSRQVAELLNDLHKQYKFKKVYVDPSAADLIKQSYDLGIPSGKRNSAGEIKSFANNDVASGISKVNSLFASDSVLVDASCSMFIHEHQSYRYKPDTEIPIKEQDDSVDAFRYGITDFSLLQNDSYFAVGHRLLGWW